MALTREAAREKPLTVAKSDCSNGRLRPGPGMQASEVAANQRARIHGAMVELVAERGYAAVTSREMASRSGVSTRTFYEHFKGGKEECFLDTYELVVRRLARRALAVQVGGQSPRERLRLALEAFAQEVVANPQAAYLALVEVHSVGPVALEPIRRAELRFEAMLEESLARMPGEVRLPPLLIKGIFAGIEQVIRTRLLAGRKQEIPQLLDPLFEWTLSFHHECATALFEQDRQAALQGASRSSPATSQTADIELGSRAGDRDIILAATAKLAALNGYAWLSAARIRTAAGVSRRRFEACFESVEDCFIAALEWRTHQALASAFDGSQGSSTWASSVRQAITSLCIEAANDPVFARLCFAEVLMATGAGMRSRERLLAEIADRLRGRDQNASPADDLSLEASVGAIWGILHHWVFANRGCLTAQSPSILSYLVLAPAIGASAALAEIKNIEAQNLIIGA